MEELDLKNKRLKIILRVFAVIIIILYVVLIGVMYLRYKRYVAMGEPRFKENLTQEEVDIICKNLYITPKDEYQVTNACYQVGEKLKAYILIGNDVDNFLVEMCNYPKKNREENDENSEKEYTTRHTTMFGEEVLANVFLLGNDGEFPRVYIWKEGENYVAEVVGLGEYDSEALIEIFPWEEPEK